MNKKVIIIIGSIIIVVLILFIALNSGNPVKNTAWTNEESVLKFGEKNFSWESQDVSRKGSYTVYKGNKAKAAIDSYVKEYNKSDDISESEKRGFELEADDMKKEMTMKSFVIREKLDSLTYKGEDVGYADSLYICEKSKDKLIITEMKTHTAYEMTACDKNTKPEAVEHGMDISEPIDDDLTSAKGIPFTYNVPEDFKKVISSDTAVRYENGEGYIFVTIMREVPLLGIIDEYPVREKTSIGNIEGYSIVRSTGADIEFVYAFDMDGDTVFIQADDKERLDDFVKTIEQ